jgi:hypothetical protein
MRCCLECFLNVSLLPIGSFTSNLLAIELTLNNAAFAALLKDTIACDVAPNVALNIVDNAYFNALFAKKNNNPSILPLNIEELFAQFNDNNVLEEKVNAAYKAIERELEREIAVIDKVEEKQKKKKSKKMTAPRNCKTTNYC